MPNSERNDTMIAPLAALNRGFSKKCMSSIGLGVCSSQHEEAGEQRGADARSPASTSGAVQPCDGASITAHRNVTSPAIDSTAPTGSSFGADGSRESGIRK